ncbi:MAG: lipopolysaccharide biosynthesis regulator YciM, partial [Myxococcota bacterium]
RASVAPLADVIRSGDPELKRGAIFSLARLERKTAVKILRDTLGKVDSETQFYVAGRLGQIEKELSDRIIRTRRMLELEPDNLELKVRLARYNKEYVESGLLEPSVERYFVRRAIDLCTAVLDEDAGRVDVMIDLAELLARRGEIVDAISTYRRVLSIEPESTGARVGLARAYFKLRDMGNLSVTLDDLARSGDVPDDLVPVIEYWTGEPAGA